jgi:diaminopimelate epimerase
MKISFSKYQGAGNDFVIINALKNNPFKDHPDSERIISLLCDRRFGIGADGLMLLAPHTSYDFEMIYYNSDGRLSTMCGNGGRCLVAFAHQKKIIDQETKFLAADGPHFATITSKSNQAFEISLSMKDVTEVKKMGNDYFLDTGSPHFVRFVEDVEDVNVFETGSVVRNSKQFAPGGTNVNFATLSDGFIKIRTYERGVEDETLACGTGITATAIAAYMEGHRNPENLYNIRARGGSLKVRFKTDKNQFSDIFLEGPATFVYKGKIHL